MSLKNRRHLPKAAMEQGTTATDEGDEEEAGHAFVDDPVLPPARMLNFAFGSAGVTGEGDNSSETRRETILSRLFDPDRKQKPELWSVSFAVH